MRSRFVFVVGIPRSGTTLVATMLGRHSSIVAGPESHFFLQTQDRELESIISGTQWPGTAHRVLRSLTSEGELVVAQFGHTDVSLRAALEEGPRSVEGALVALHSQLISEVESPTWICEKTPDHLRHLPSIAANFPDCVVLHVVRDPRSICLSQTKVPWASDSALHNAYRLRDRYETARRDFGSVACLHTIKYEELVEAPAEVMTEALSVLGLSFEQSMLEPSAGDARLVPSTEPWKQGALSDVRRDRADSWLLDLPSQTSSSILSICDRYASDFGYPAAEGTLRLPIRRLGREEVERRLFDLEQASLDGVTCVPAVPGEGDDPIYATPPGRSGEHGLSEFLRSVVASLWRAGPRPVVLLPPDRSRAERRRRRLFRWFCSWSAETKSLAEVVREHQ